jgi:hypothetical protein
MKATLLGALGACLITSACSASVSTVAPIGPLAAPATTTFSRQVILPPDPATVLPYALGVPTGRCPADVVSVSADGDRTILKVTAAPAQTVSYSVQSDDPSFAITDSTTVSTGMTGNEFSIPAPLSKIRSIAIFATGNDVQLRSRCSVGPG